MGTGPRAIKGLTGLGNKGLASSQKAGCFQGWDLGPLCIFCQGYAWLSLLSLKYSLFYFVLLPIEQHLHFSSKQETPATAGVTVTCIICNHTSPAILMDGHTSGWAAQVNPSGRHEVAEKAATLRKGVCININMQIINKNIKILYGLKLWQCICVCSWKCSNVSWLIKMNFY